MFKKLGLGFVFEMEKGDMQKQSQTTFSVLLQFASQVVSIMLLKQPQELEPKALDFS